MSIDLDAIRARHAESDDDIEDFRWDLDNEGVKAHVDRGALLAEVDRLTAQRDALRRGVFGAIVAVEQGFDFTAYSTLRDLLNDSTDGGAS